MPYNKDLDKVVREESVDVEGGKIMVSVYSYNGGEEKVQVGPRMVEKKSGGYSFRKLGRMTVDESVKVMVALSNINNGLMGG